MLANLFVPTLTATLTAGCAYVHYGVLQLCNATLSRMRLTNNRVKVLLAVGSALVSHITQIALFAAAFYYLQDSVGLGSIAGNFKDVASTFLYFSTEAYTSLGFGDVFPLGPIRFVAGIEALTGLVMIGWTASFTYLVMSRYWRSEATTL
jgi:hypothetical protein